MDRHDASEERRVLSWASAAGAKAVRLDVIHSNGRARRFYERLGFRITGGETVRERDGEMEVQMEQRLGGGPAAPS